MLPYPTYGCVRGKAIYFSGSAATGMPTQRQVKPQNSPDRPTPSRSAFAPRSHGRLCAKRENKSAGPELPMKEFTYKICRDVKSARQPNLIDSLASTALLLAVPDVRTVSNITTDRHTLPFDTCVRQSLCVVGQ
jgi:hypothetical protein